MELSLAAVAMRAVAVTTNKHTVRTYLPFVCDFPRFNEYEKTLPF